jgi:hypothetical protein
LQFQITTRDTAASVYDEVELAPELEATPVYHQQNVTGHCAVLLESRNYLLAVRYGDGEIWLFEYDVVSSVGVQQMV